MSILPHWFIPSLLPLHLVRTSNSNTFHISILLCTHPITIFFPPCNPYLTCILFLSPSTYSSYLQSIPHFNFTLHSSNYNFLSSIQSTLNMHTISTFSNVYTYDSVSYMLAYKPVVKKVHLVVALMDKKYHIMCSLPNNLLAGLVPLPMHPLDFTPGEHFIQECTDTLDLDPIKWLWPEELKLICWIVYKHKKTFSWDPVE